MKRHLLIILGLLVFLGLANSCTITGPATGTINTDLTYSITKSPGGTIGNSANCGIGGIKTLITDTQISCRYSSADQKTISATETGESSSTCQLSVSISSASNAAPTISVSSPASGSTLTAGQAVTVSGSATDDAGVSLVEVQIATDGTCGDGVWQSASGTNSWSFQYTPLSGKFGCKLKARSKDNTNQYSAETIISFSTSTVVAANQCIATCNSKVKTTCPGGNTQPVQCCAATDCTATCTADKKYQASTCSASNACTYSAAQFVVGKCGYGSACQISSSNQTAIGQQTAFTIKYQNYSDSAPGTVTLNCGDGHSTSISCLGSSGECHAICVYNSSGTYLSRATIQGIACTAQSLTVSAQSGTTGQNPPQTNPNPITQPLNCNISTASEVKVGDRAVAMVSYSGATFAPGIVTLACGNGRTATVPGCISNVYGIGQCSSNCLYENPGNYVISTSIQGKVCTTAQVRVVPQVQANSSHAIQTTNSNGEEAELSIQNFATTPATILENVSTRLTAIVSSSSPVKNATCTSLESNGRSTCSCALSQTTSANPVLECTIQPPVRGTYEITFTNAEGKTKTALVPLTPGQVAKIEVINKATDYTFYAFIGLIVLLVAYGGYFVYNKVTEKLGQKDRLYKRRDELLREINFTKASYMKGQIGQDQFQRIYSARQGELSTINLKISEIEKSAKK